MTYYIDNFGGADANDGRSPESAWKTLEKANSVVYEPGDSILFKRGCTWEGMFYPSGSGSEEAKITAGAYGEGYAPCIDGCGMEAAILIKNVDYWTVKDIKCKNTAAQRSIRSGIKIMGRPYGITRGIQILGCEVTEVHGENRRGMPYYKSMYWNSGIYVSFPDRTTGENHLDDILIQGNYVHDVWTSGIRVNQDEDVKNDCNHTNVVVRGNKIERTGTDGMIIANCDAPLIEYNRCYDAGALGNKEDTFLIAGVWVCATNNALIQYNEVARTRLFDNDGTAFDTDWGTAGKTIFRNNYSHENGGGFWLDCTAFNLNEKCEGTILENNVSVNDKRCLVQADTGIETMFKNNLFINTQDDFSICVQAEGKAHKYEGNTFAFSKTPDDDWGGSVYEGNYYSKGLSNASDKDAKVSDKDYLDAINIDDLDGKEGKFGLSFERKNG